jgi:hypothetical protein
MRNWFQAFAFKCNLYRYTLAEVLACLVRHFRGVPSALPLFSQPIGALPIGTWTAALGGFRGPQRQPGGGGDPAAGVEGGDPHVAASSAAAAAAAAAATPAPGLLPIKAILPTVGGCTSCQFICPTALESAWFLSTLETET